MKLLVLSDTHGDFSHINKLARKHRADAVIHCGDFSFLSYEDLETFPGRELSLNIKHWKSVPPDIRRQVWDLGMQTKIELSKEYRVLGDIDLYLDGTKEFEVPVYVTWGNHENMQMIRQFLSGEKSIHNLHLVTHEGVELTEKLSLFGIGGNFSIRRFFSKPYSENFYPYMTHEEWVRLYINAKKAKKAKKNVWVMTHVSPGKIPLLEHFSTKIRAQAWFSGHMGAPMPQQYSLFTQMDDADFVQRLQFLVNYARDMWISKYKRWKLDVDTYTLIDELEPGLDKEEFAAKTGVDAKDINQFYGHYYRTHLGHKLRSPYPSSQVLSMLKGTEHLFDVDIKHEPVTRGNYHARKRAVVVKGTRFFNLPDAPDGYVLLESDNSQHFSVTSFGNLY